MATMGKGNPVELFNMHVAHVGINAKDPQEAERIAKQFELLLGLAPREKPISFFSDTIRPLPRHGCASAAWSSLRNLACSMRMARRF